MKGTMKAKHFNQLRRSIGQMGRIMRGEKVPARQISARPVPPTPKEVRALRTKILNLTQMEFSRVMGESVSAVRHWEQGIRNPSGSATRLMGLLQIHPETLKELA